MNMYCGMDNHLSLIWRIRQFTEKQKKRYMSLIIILE